MPMSQFDRFVGKSKFRYRDLLGVVPDNDIAKEFGVKVCTVKNARRLRGIPPGLYERVCFCGRPFATPSPRRIHCSLACQSSYINALSPKAMTQFPPSLLESLRTDRTIRSIFAALALWGGMIQFAKDNPAVPRCAYHNRRIKWRRKYSKKVWR